MAVIHMLKLHPPPQKANSLGTAAEASFQVLSLCGLLTAVSRCISVHSVMSQCWGVQLVAAALGSSESPPNPAQRPPGTRTNWSLQQTGTRILTEEWFTEVS